jgi:hypothetical protein
MKPTDEAINQALQKALKRRFDSFEVQPSNRLSFGVLGAIKQPNYINFTRFSTILILVLVGSIGTLGVLEFWPDGGKADSTKTPSIVTKSGMGASSIFLITDNQTSGKQNKKSEEVPLPSNEKNHSYPIRLQAEVPEIEQAYKLPILSHIPAGKTHTEPRSYINQSTQNFDIYPPFISQNTTDPGFVTENKTIDSNELVQQVLVESLDQSVSTRFDRDVKKLQPHQLPTTRPISTPTLEIPPQMPPNEVPRTLSSDWRGVISFTPTNTYQRLTVLPQMHVQYQNFELTPLFSVQTAGFNLRGGVEQKGFQVLINYSRFTQKIAYEIALDEYTVQPQGTSTYTIARGGSSQTEEITFQLVGLSLQKKFFIPTRLLSDFYVFTGATLSHDLTTSHNLAWGTFGIGKSWPVAPSASLSLIPQLSLGLNAIKTNDDAFKNRFYQLGLAIELTFGKN